MNNIFTVLLYPLDCVFASPSFTPVPRKVYDRLNRLGTAVVVECSRKCDTILQPVNYYDQHSSGITVRLEFVAAVHMYTWITLTTHMLRRDGGAIKYNAGHLF